MKSTAIKHVFPRSVVDGGRELHGGARPPGRLPGGYQYDAARGAGRWRPLPPVTAKYFRGHP